MRLRVWIALGNPRRALSFIREMQAELRAIAANPYLYQLRPDLGPDARLRAFGRYVILFRVRGDIVRIERVVFGGRDLNDLLP